MDLSMYYENIDKMRCGDVALFRSYKPVGRLIRFISWFRGLFSKKQKGDWSHVAFINSAIKGTFAEMLYNGCVETSIVARLKSTKGQVYWFPLGAVYDRFRPLICKNIQHYLDENTPYGWWEFGDEGVGDGADLDDSTMICSEFIQQVFMRSGMLQGTDTSVWKPADVEYCAGVFGQILSGGIKIWDSNL